MHSYRSSDKDSNPSNKSSPSRLVQQKQTNQLSMKLQQVKNDFQDDQKIGKINQESKRVKSIFIRQQKVREQFQKYVQKNRSQEKGHSSVLQSSRNYQQKNNNILQLIKSEKTPNNIQKKNQQIIQQLIQKKQQQKKLALIQNLSQQPQQQQHKADILQKQQMQGYRNENQEQGQYIPEKLSLNYDKIDKNKSLYSVIKECQKNNNNNDNQNNINQYSLAYINEFKQKNLSQSRALQNIDQENIQNIRKIRGKRQLKVPEKSQNISQNTSFAQYNNKNQREIRSQTENSKKSIAQNVQQQLQQPSVQLNFPECQQNKEQNIKLQEFNNYNFCTTVNTVNTPNSNSTFNGPYYYMKGNEGNVQQNNDLGTPKSSVKSFLENSGQKQFLPSSQYPKYLSRRKSAHGRQNKTILDKKYSFQAQKTIQNKNQFQEQAQNQQYVKERGIEFADSYINVNNNCYNFQKNQCLQRQKSEKMQEIQHILEKEEEIKKEQHKMKTNLLKDLTLNEKIQRKQTQQQQKPQLFLKQQENIQQNSQNNNNNNMRVIMSKKTQFNPSSERRNFLQNISSKNSARPMKKIQNIGENEKNKMKDKENLLWDIDLCPWDNN